jgi:hypothetical protein
VGPAANSIAILKNGYIRILVLQNWTHQFVSYSPCTSKTVSKRTWLWFNVNKLTFCNQDHTEGINLLTSSFSNILYKTNTSRNEVLYVTAIGSSLHVVVQIPLLQLVL